MQTSQKKESISKISEKLEDYHSKGIEQYSIILSFKEFDNTLDAASIKKRDFKQKHDITKLKNLLRIYRNHIITNRANSLKHDSITRIIEKVNNTNKKIQRSIK